jgi:phage shock protein C
MATKRKKIKKSKNKIISGVIGGLGEYYNTDPTILRIAWLLIFSITGFIPGILAYIGASLIMPDK